MNIKPWEAFPDIWPTEARFITWVRGVLRKGWANHPVKLEYLNSKKHKITNTNPKSKKTYPKVWGYICEQCNEEVTKVEVDHAGNVQGKFTCMDDIQGYAEHLFLVDFNSLEVCCIPCHQIRSYAQKLGISFEEARFEKLLIATFKDKKKMLQILKEHDIMAKNDTQRREALRSILKGEM